MVRLPENHELRRCLERGSVRPERGMGVPPSAHGTANARRSEASLPLAISLVDGASLSHSSVGHCPFLGCVFLWAALHTGETRAWHAIRADGAWGLPARAIFEPTSPPCAPTIRAGKSI